MSAKIENGRQRNSRGEGAKLRAEIVAGAAALLEETRDAGAVTLRAIARSVGIAAPSIYRHFEGQSQVMLAVVQESFAALESELWRSVDAASDAPREELLAACHAYLDFAAEHPGGYRAMFGGVWVPNLDDTISDDDLVALGAGATGILSSALRRCVDAGVSTSDDPDVDTIALWLGLHGVAHQRSATRIFPGPEGIEDRMIVALARLV